MHQILQKAALFYSPVRGKIPEFLLPPLEGDIIEKALFKKKEASAGKSELLTTIETLQ